MNWNFKDTVVLFSMAFAVISMSFVFPALGLGLEQQNTTDIPEFNTTQERFNTTKDYPPFPEQPDEGVLNHTSDAFDDFEGQIQFELGTDSNGNRTFLVVNPENETYLLDVENQSKEDVIIWSVGEDGEVKTLEANGYEVDLHAVSVSDGVYDYQIVERPGTSDIPILGGLLNAGGEIVTVLWWAYVVFVYFAQSLFASAANVLGQGIDIGIYIIEFLHWLLSTYFSLSDGTSNSFVSVILYMPVILLMLMFAKLSAVIFSVVVRGGG